MAKPNKPFRGKVILTTGKPTEEPKQPQTKLEKMVSDCETNEQFQKQDLKGNKYCSLIFPGDNKGHCTYLGEIKDYEFKNKNGLTYPMSYYGCKK